MNVYRLLRGTLKFHQKPNFLRCLHENGLDFRNRPSERSYCKRDYLRRYEDIVTPTSEGFLSKISKKLNFFTSKYKLEFTGTMLLQVIVDNTNYPRMMVKLNLPDTFYSWFVITELYVWMIVVRYMAEGESGKLVRNGLIEALWTDVKHRAHQLGASNPSLLKIQMNELSEQLNASLVAYDEGLQSSDAALAGALWRRIYAEETVDPESLDLLVRYVRRQIKILDNLTPKQLFEDRDFKFEPFVSNK